MKRRSPEKRRGAAGPRAPSPRVPGYDDILAIARLVEAGSRFTEFRLRSGDIEVEVKRANGAASAPSGPGPLPPGGRGDEGEPAAPAALVAPAKAGAQPPEHALPEGAHVIRAPMVGTFYRAPEPGAPPFVEPGARVEPRTIVCIVEVMKLMNSVRAGVRGVVTHVLAENAALVERGQPLVAIRPE